MIFNLLNLICTLHTPTLFVHIIKREIIKSQSRQHSTIKHFFFTKYLKSTENNKYRDYTSDMAKIVLGRSSITTRAGRIQDVARFDETDVVNVRIESELFRK